MGNGLNRKDKCTISCAQRIVPPVLDSFTDQDSRVRYYACEASLWIIFPAFSHFEQSLLAHLRPQYRTNLLCQNSD